MTTPTTSAGPAPTLRAAIIGCGAISNEHLTAIADSPVSTLVGVCDRSPAAARWTGERHGAAWFTDAGDLLASARPDIVHVLTPPRSHGPLAEQCLVAGAHVLVEKPVAATAAEYDALAKIAAGAGRILLENHNYLCNDNVLTVDGLVAGGALGEVCDVELLLSVDLVDGRFADPLLASPVGHLDGGAVRDFLTHLTYLALHHFPDVQWDRVDGRWRNSTGITELGYDDLAAQIGFGDGRAAIRFSSRVKPECFRMTVRGTRGTAEIELFQPYVRVEIPRGPKVLSPLLNHARNGGAFVGAAAGGFRNKILQRSPYHGLHRFVARLHEALATGGALPTTPDEVRRTCLLVDEIVATIPARSDR